MFTGQTFIQDQSNAVSQMYSEDSLESGSTRSNRCENNNQRNDPKKTRTGSIILAGHLAGEQSISLPDSYENACKDRQAPSRDISVSDETSYLSMNLDLNKCINLFHNECLRESCTSEEPSNSVTLEDRVNGCVPNKNKTVEVQCNLSRDYPRSVSLILLRNISPRPHNEIRKYKSCVNLDENFRKCNSGVQTDPSLANGGISPMIQIKLMPYETLLVSKSSALPNEKTDSHATKEDQKCDSVCSEQSSKEGLNPFELKALLNSLDDQRSKKAEGMMKKPLFRRMSANFHDSPNKFTEQLLTIIEESVINSDACGSLEYPEVSLCRLTEELRKMCKFVAIEDETVPEWPQSPSMLAPNDKKNSENCQESRLDSPPKSFVAVAKTPDTHRCADRPAPLLTRTRNIKSPRRIYRHVPPKMISVQSPKLHNDSMCTFESLEAFCKELYPNDYKTPAAEKYSESHEQTMKHILHKCKSQMASLENSPNVCEQQRKPAASTVDSAPDSATPETQDLRYKLHKERDKVGSMRISDVLEHVQHPDDQNMIMYELAKKRQRCLDTARVMREIDASSEVTSSTAETQETDSSNAIADRSLDINDSKFMETLMTVKKYQNYLEEHQPLLNLLQRMESDTSRLSCGEKDDGFNKANKAESLKVSKSPATRQKSPSAKRCSLNKVVVAKPRLFVTPGKTPVKRTCNAKRTYFPNLISETSKQKGRAISPHEKNVYRQMGSYDHVISPVGMYIRSTNPSLVKNLRPKTDEMLLTPRKKVASSASPKLMFRLSPKEDRQVRTGIIFLCYICIIYI